MPGFTITGELSSDVTGSTWAALRTLDDRPLVLKIILVPDVTAALAHAARTTAVLDRIGSGHLVRQHGAIALAEGALALVLDQVTGGSVAQLLGDRGHLTSGETVTTVAPLFGALADLHDAGIEHGDLAPGCVLYSADGRPMMSELGVAGLLEPAAGSVDRAACFAAPEVLAGDAPSSASDVYSMAALGWFCLVGAPPGPASTRPSLGRLSPRTPALLVDILAACLSTDPTVRPSARAAAIEVFNAAPAVSVVLNSVPDPATEITRRIRDSAAGPASVLAPPPNGKPLRRSMILGAVALLAFVAIVGGATWLLGRTPGPRPPGLRPPGLQPPGLQPRHHPSRRQQCRMP